MNFKEGREGYMRWFGGRKEKGKTERGNMVHARLPEYDGRRMQFDCGLFTGNSSGGCGILSDVRGAGCENTGKTRSYLYSQCGLCFGVFNVEMTGVS